MPIDNTAYISVELGHGDGLRAGSAGPALQGVLDDQSLGPPARRGPVHLQQVRPEAGVVLADTPSAEATGTPGRLGAEPAQHVGLLLDDQDIDPGGPTDAA